MKRLAPYSQHLLRGTDLIKELVGHSNIKKTDMVYDIGAGTGAITAVLATRARYVLAIESEPRMASKLRENMEYYPQVEVIEGDFLKMPLPKAPYKIFSNIPFHISSQIVRKLVESEFPPEAAYLIVQRQFARKLLIGEVEFTGLLGATIAPWFMAKIKRPLRRSDYTPPPNVDTVLIELKPRPEPALPRKDMARYQAMLEDCFSDPKKFAKTPRKQAGIPEDIKPSQMSLAQWVMLFQAVKSGR